MGKIKIRKIALLAALLLILSLFAFISRGPHVSNLLKRLILPELSIATGREVVAQKIYVNILPLFIEAKEVKVFEGGDEIMRIPRVKGYIEISGLLRKKLVLRRLVVKEPDIRSDASRLEDIIEKVKHYLSVERRTPLKVIVKAVVMDNGKFVFGYKDMLFHGSGFSGEAILNAWENFVTTKHLLPRINFSLKELSSSIEGWPELKGGIRGAIALKDDEIEVKGLQIGFYNSTIDASGNFSTEGGLQEEQGSPHASGEFHLRFDLLMESFKRIFRLKQQGEGEVSGKGTIHLVTKDLLQSVVDLELKGEFYVQALMELLKVEERVEGLVDFAGNIKGPLNSLTGTAKARLRNGNLFNVDVDDLMCNVSYGDSKLNFRDGKSTLYNGRAEAESTVSISGDGYYSLSVRFSDVDSPAALNLIGWKPEIPLGKVRGELSTSGFGFNPSVSFSYESIARGKDFLGRVRRIKGSFNLRDDVINFSDSMVSTDDSVINFSGAANIGIRTLSLTIQARTSDLKDITLPYLNELTGSGEFSGMVTGSFENPAINGKMHLSAASFEDYNLGDVTGDLGYKRDLLEVRDASAVAGNEQSIGMKGTIRFPESKELFDFKKPLYGLSVSMKNADLERFMKVFYKKTLKPHPKGRFDSVLSITGKGPAPLYRGSARITNAQMDSVSIDSASLSFSYDYTDFVVEDAFVKKGDSTLAAKGSISHDDRFSLKVSSSKIYLKDLFPKGLPLDTYVTLRAEGDGTVDNPEMEMDGTIYGGRYKEVDLGGGKIKASVKDKTLLLDVMLLDGKVTLSGKADIRDEMPWTAHLDVKSGRYDFLVTPFVKEIPEDFFLNMKGSADMSGNKNHFSVAAVINQLNTTFYGNNFSNDADIRFEMRDRKVMLSAVKLRSGSTSFKVSGEMEMGREYNLVMEGDSTLTPLKGLSKKIDTIRGDAGFVFSITGKWDNPRIDGGVTVTNGVFGIKDFSYRLSSINGYLYIDGDRIVIQKLSAKFGGGDTEISGIALLQGFSMRRFQINAVMSNIGINISKDLTVNFNGGILYTGVPDSQTLSGEIRINRAAYTEPVEWQSWLLKAKAKEKPRGGIGTFEKTKLNIRIQGTDNVLINNNIARVSLKVDAVLLGIVSNPLIVGRVETKTGIVYFRNNEFKILSASADFADPKKINPTVDIAAETTIEGYTIRMILEGQLDHFTMSLSSTPSLEEIEILNLLTVGTLPTEPKGIQGGISVNSATSFLSGQIQDITRERLRSITGIDRIGVEPSISKVTGQSEQRLTVSKRLIGDRLSVTYSTAFGSVETDVIMIEYNIGNNISLIGERDETGGFGGNIRFRFGFK